MLFEFKNIIYELGNNRRIAVSGAVENGSVLVIRGASGAGKSTLLRILARLQPALSGDMFLQGVGWQEMASPLWRAKVHYVAQQTALFEGTVAENLALPFSMQLFGGKALDVVNAKGLMEELRLPVQLWEQDARTLSGGEAARLAFVRSLLIEPTLLLLDEPTAALDEQARQAFYEVLGRWLAVQGHGALLISHNDDYYDLQRITMLDIVPREV